MMTGKARVAGVVGWPVAHSRSPRLHGYWLREYAIDGAYIPMSIEPDHIAKAMRGLPLLGIAGCNVTLPHKEAVFAVMDEVDDHAQRIGAVNTVIVGSDGRLIGSNTDGYGYMENLRQCVPDWQADAGPVVVLGAGGAARSICVALIDAGVPELRIVNRTLARAEVLAKDIGARLKPIDWAFHQEALASASLLVNTTTLGMVNHPPLAINLTRLAPKAVVSDIVYIPLETELLRRARERGNTVVDGLGMLLHQARPGFAAWFRREPQVTTALREFMLEDLVD